MTPPRGKADQYPAFFPDSERGMSMRTRGERGSFCSPVPAYPPPTLRGKTGVCGALGYGQQEQNGTNSPDKYPDTFEETAPNADAVRVTSGFYASLFCLPYTAYTAGWLGGA